MFSSKVIRTEGAYPRFTDQLRPIDRIDIGKEKYEREDAEIAMLKETAYKEGHALGYRDGFSDSQQKGHQEGYDAGYAESKAAFEAEHAEVLQNLQTSLMALLADFQVAIDGWFTAAEQQYADIAYEVVRKAVGAELKNNREVVVSIAHDILKDVRSGMEVKVRVNPSDVSILEGHRQDLMDALAGIGNLEVVADRTVLHGVVIETQEGIIDARVETFVERVCEPVAHKGEVIQIAPIDLREAA